MTIHRLKFFVLTSVFALIGMAGQAQAVDKPVAMVTQTQGTVEFSKDGEKWKEVSRNKLLGEGYQLRTAADGSAKLINQTNNSTQNMGASSVVKITPDGIEKISGTLSAPEQSSGDLLENLDKRFAKAQRYTTVRRSVDKSKTTRLDTITEISLSPQYPELVWSNVGPEFSYELVINGKSTPVAASTSTDEIIRYKVTGLTPGKHTFQVNL
ncbi:MAG: hypothetical protein HQL94_04855, partial [Magnetococcales bacterium]|nr:hypothetical protein [Magnetococcales bacterium]